MRFKIFLQYAHHDEDEFEESSGTSDDVLKAFDKFDWAGETKKAAEIQVISPTVSVETENGDLIWVSGVDENEFVSEFTERPTAAKSETKDNWFSRLLKPSPVFRHDTQNFTRVQARRALELFSKAEFQSLVAHYREANSS
ncbi:MAG TPA: hypothetical protein VMM38_03490 [Aridibacter sp.]|nr:hypothetical protein [Aridibacter sp.]